MKRALISLRWLSVEWLPQAPGVFGVAFFLHAWPFRIVSCVGGLSMAFGVLETEGDTDDR